MIQFSKSRQFFEWRNADSLLLVVMRDVVSFWEPMGMVMVVTSIWRTSSEDQKLGGSGVHCSSPHRAIDLDGLDQEGLDEVAEKVNAKWVYDPARPQKVVAYSKPHGTGRHLHIQVHPATTRR